MDKRHFTVVEKNGKEHGLYVSSTPSSAAKKAVSKLCASNKSKNVEFYLREITQGSKKKTYGPYIGEMKKLKTPIELKGRVIKYETIVHLKKVKNNMKGGKYRLFSCANDTKKIGELCLNTTNGQYYDEKECEKECLDQKLHEELDAWRKLFEWCSENLPDNPIYCKGGSALGLEVLKSILNKEPTKYEEFCTLKLIKDWDFTVLLSEEEKNLFIEEAKKLGIENQGKTIAILRFKKGLKIDDDYLLELSAKTEQLLNNLEMPLTNLKFEVNSNNIELFFQIVEMFVKHNYNFGIMKENLDQLLNPIRVNGEDLVDSIQNGFYIITDPLKIATAKLSDTLLQLIDSFLESNYNSKVNSKVNVNSNPKVNSNSINKLSMKQFLITQLSEPDRLFLRFLKKNSIKSKNIKKFYQENEIEIPYWLMNEEDLNKLERTINSFLDYLKSHIQIELGISDDLLKIDTDTDSKKEIKRRFAEFIKKMEDLFINVNFPRLQNDKIDKDNIEKIFPIFIFKKLKDYIFARKQAKNNKEIQKLIENGKFNIAEKKIKALEIESKNQQSIKYELFLPPGDGKYNSFLRFYLNFYVK